MKLASERSFCILSGISGIAGVAMLAISFAINNGPPLGSPPELFDRFVRESFVKILWGAWLQAVGPVFIVLLAFAMVLVAGYATRLAGWMTFFGATVLMCVSLIEITFYISALFSDPRLITPISFRLIYSVQHLYFIVAAPALFLPLGIVIWRSQVISRIFGLLAIVLGVAFGAVGMTSLTTLTLPASVTSMGSAQALWWLTAAVAFLFQAGRHSGTKAATTSVESKSQS